MDNQRFNYMTPKSKNSNNDEKIKIQIKLDAIELDSILSYIVSEDPSIIRNNILSLKKLFSIIDMTYYNSNNQLLDKINLINKAIDIRLSQGNLANKNFIERSLSGGLEADPIRIRDVNETEKAWIQNMCNQVLTNSHLQAASLEGIELLTKLNSSDYSSRNETAKKIEEWINKVQNNLRRDKIDSVEDMTFSLQSDNLENIIRETHRHITSPRHTLKFGTQALNMITGGGVQAGRVYLLLGLPAEGKSSTLLDMAIQIKKYNSNYLCADKSKRPCVLLFTMENPVIETVERLYSMMVHSSIKDAANEDDAVNNFTKQGLVISDTDPIDIIIKFKPVLSEDTSYLYKLIDDLNDSGYECICIIQDYIKRIHSAQGTFSNDYRRELGEVVNEFKMLASLKQIPVISASQLNRTATENIDTARSKNKTDLVRILGRSNVAESNLILENADWVAQIAPENDPEGNKYLGIQCVKHRYNIPDEHLRFFMPYIPKTIKLIEDIYTKPVHRLTMSLNSDIIFNNYGMSTNIIGSPIGRSIVKVDGANFEDDDSNIFRNMSAFIGKNLKRNIVLNNTTSRPKELLYELLYDGNKKVLLCESTK